MNIIKNFNHHCELIYAQHHQDRILPYASIFDLLHHFNNSTLNDNIAAIFDHFLPKTAHYKNNIDLWVDLESLGDITCLLAKELAYQLAEHINDLHLVKITYVCYSEKNLTRDNYVLLNYLTKLSSKFSIAYNPKFEAKKQFDDAIYLKWPSLAGSHHLDYNHHIAIVLNYAWRCAELGAEIIGFRILQQAIKQVSSNDLKSLYRSQLQYMRVASQHYQAAADEEVHAEDLDPELHHALYLTKAWGCILSRQIDRAKYCFSQAGMSMHYQPSDINSLYRMNIFALLQHLSGNTHNALLIENSIQSAIQQLNEPRPQIEYINSINLARLNRYTRNFSQSISHYNAAFNTVTGIKSETDFIYSNVCYGMLHEKQADSTKALHHWLKASLHWLVSDTPEALGWRAVRAIMQPDFKPRSQLNPDRISHALFGKLRELADACDININLKKTPHLAIILGDHTSHFQNSQSYAIDGLSTITSQFRSTITYSSAQIELAHLVTALLYFYLPITETNVTTLIVDRTDGNEIPQNLHSVMRSCLLHNIFQVTINHKKIHLDYKLRCLLQENLLLTPSPSILEFKYMQCDYPYVKHKRYYYRKRLTKSESELLQILQFEHQFPIINKIMPLDNNYLLSLLSRGLIHIGFNDKVEKLLF